MKTLAKRKTIGVLWTEKLALLVTYLSLFCIIVIQSYQLLHTVLHSVARDATVWMDYNFPITLLDVKYVLVCSPMPYLSFPSPITLSSLLCLHFLSPSSPLLFSLFSVSVTVSYINILLNIPLCTCKKTIAFELISLNFEIEWKITL